MKVYKHPTHSNVTVVELPKKEIKKIDFAICKQPKETLKSFYDRQEKKPDFIINGGIFNLSDGKTYFNFKDEGETISGWHWYTAGMGVVDGELKYGHIGSEEWTDFVSAYPPLVEDGKALAITYATENSKNKRRSILAYDNENIYLIAVEGNGMTYGEVQAVLLDMGVDYAINLDGGASTKILQDGKSITSTVYNRAVDNVVAVYLKVIHRVQVGAFTNKLYAMAMQTKIRALPDHIGAGYKNAYVRKIGKYYKVQVGAFSKWAGANLVLADLKAMGFDAFITTE